MCRCIRKCLCCGGDNLYEYFSLDYQPLANNLKDTKEESTGLYPLALNVCRTCFHSQLTVSVDKELLFKNYLYVSGTSRSLRKYFQSLAKKIIKITGFGKGTKIMDIACNDGTFLEFFDNWKRYGIDPAENLRKVAVKKGIKVFTEFFPFPIKTKFDVITGLNVLAHTDQPYEFLVGCKDILTDGGYIFIQTSQRDMVVNGEYDTVYHEHQSFFTIKSMIELVKRAGLCLVNVEKMDVHGGSLLFTIRKQGKAYANLEKDERYVFSTYKTFQNEAEVNKRSLLKLIDILELPVVGYGAAAKGVVLLNYLGLSPDYVVDDNPLKQGKVIGGINSPICSIDKLREDERDLTILILPWNMYEDIIENIKAVRDNPRDKFIKPFPILEVR